LRIGFVSAIAVFRATQAQSRQQHPKPEAGGDLKHLHEAFTVASGDEQTLDHGLTLSGAFQFRYSINSSGPKVAWPLSLRPDRFKWPKRRPRRWSVSVIRRLSSTMAIWMALDAFGLPPD